MSTLSIEVWDATGNKKQVVELPSDAVVNRVIAVLVEKMNLPRHSPDGQLMSYKFHHKSSGRQLLEDETLSGAGVQAGDILRLQPEITAGAIGAGLPQRAGCPGRREAGSRSDKNRHRAGPRGCRPPANNYARTESILAASRPPAGTGGPPARLPR